MVVLFLVKLDFLLVGKRTYFGKEVIVYLEFLVEGFEFLVFVLQLLPVLLDVAGSGFDNHAFGYEVAVIVCVLGSIDGDEEVGHDTSTSVNGTSHTLGLCFQGVGKMDTVRMNHFSMIEAVYQFLVILILTVLAGQAAVEVGGAVVRLLDTTARRSIVAGDSEANHGTVRQVDRTLYQSLAESAASYYHASVPVLDGSGHDFTGRSGVLVHQYDETAVLEVARTFGKEITAACGPSFGVDDEFFLLQKLVGKVDGGIQIPSSVTLQVEDEVFHSFLLQAFQGFCKLFGSGCPEAVDAYIAGFGLYHVRGVQTQNGNFVALHGEVQLVVHATAHDGQFHLRVFRPAQAAHNIFRAHFYSGNGAVVDGYDTVAGKDAHLLGRSVAHGLYHKQGIFYHLKLYADALEIALQRFVHLLHFFGVVVGGVRVELCQHLDDGFFHQLVFIHLVHIKVGDGKLCHLQFAQGFIVRLLRLRRHRAYTYYNSK